MVEGDECRPLEQARGTDGRETRRHEAVVPRRGDRLLQLQQQLDAAWLRPRAQLREARDRWRDVPDRGRALRVDTAAAIGGPIERLVVDDDGDAIAGPLDVEFDLIGARGGASFERRDRVLRSERGGPTVADDAEAGA